MSLSNEQAIKLVQSPPNRSEVKKGGKYQSRLRLLSLPLFRDDMNQETAWYELNNNLQSKLTAEKYKAICKYFTFPMSIVNISNDIVMDLYKVFDGRNAVFSVDYPNDRIKETASTLLSELDVRGWIETEGKKVLKCAPNTVVVIDKDSNGDPVLLAVPNEKIVGYEFTKEGDFEYIIFIHSKGKDENGKEWTKYAVYDDTAYRVVLESNGLYSVEEFPHDLGACPARFFYDNPLVNKHQFDRSIPTSPVMGAMGQWQVFDLFDFYQDHYASFQVIQYADNGCENDGCNDGTIWVDPVLSGEDNSIVTQGYNMECSTCAKKGLIGAGSAIGIQVSTDSDEQDTRDIFKFIAPDITSLEYMIKKQATRQRFIKENTVGFSDAITSEAVNETQIKALVESRKKPLLDIKGHLDNLYKWMVTSIVKLTYSVDVVVNANYGTEFFILQPEEIQDLIIKSKAAGSQATYIEQLNRLLIATEYKGDPNLVQRMLISADVQPNSYQTQEEVRKLFGEGMVTREDYYIHSNFTDLLGRFERENGSIVVFGRELSYDKKIQRIYDTLLFYTNQKLPQNEQDDTAQQAGTSPQGISDN